MVYDEESKEAAIIDPGFESDKIIDLMADKLIGVVFSDKDNKEILSNPFSDEPLNTSDICIRFTNNDAYERKIISYIIGEGNLGKWD